MLIFLQDNTDGKEPNGNTARYEIVINVIDVQKYISSEKF